MNRVNPKYILRNHLAEGGDRSAAGWGFHGETHRLG